MGAIGAISGAVGRGRRGMGRQGDGGGKEKPPAEGKPGADDAICGAAGAGGWVTLGADIAAVARDTIEPVRGAETHAARYVPYALLVVLRESAFVEARDGVLVNHAAFLPGRVPSRAVPMQYHVKPVSVIRR